MWCFPVFVDGNFLKAKHIWFSFISIGDGVIKSLRVLIKVELNDMCGVIHLEAKGFFFEQRAFDGVGCMIAWGFILEAVDALIIQFSLFAFRHFVIVRTEGTARILRAVFRDVVKRTTFKALSNVVSPVNFVNMPSTSNFAKGEDSCE